MGDRTPDTSVLDQDDPPAESSGAARDAGPDAADKHSGQPPAEPTSDPAPARTPEERDERGTPEKPDAAETPEGPEKPEKPAAPEDPEAPRAAAGASSDAEEDEAAPDKGAEAVAEADDSEPGEDAGPPSEDAGTAAAEDDTAKDRGAGATAEGEPGPTAGTDPPEPDEDTERTGEEDGPAPDEAPEAAAGDEGGERSPAESSESTRTVVLRPLQDAPGTDRTVAADVAGLRRTEPPAPPASPVGLLAPLTDTPPPPPTTARAVLRRVKIWAPVVALLALVALVVQLVRPLPEPTLALDAKASSFTIGGGTFTMPWPEKGQAAVMVAGSGTIGTFGEQKPVPTASVAKIMTAYVILRERPLTKDEPGPRVVVDARTVEEGRSKHESRIEGLRVGQSFDLRNMLKMLMIPSGNNVARLLARWHTGSENEAAFVRKMNEAARSLGMKDTVYTDPSGLDEGTVSTAVDQLKLAEAVMKFDSFRQVVALPDADIPGAGRIYNNNTLLTAAALSVRGIKTGSNTPAGGTLSWAAYKTVGGEDRLILGTMMDQHAPPPDPNGANSLELVLDNSEKVIKALREALTSATAVRKGQVVGHVDDGLGGRTPVVATRDLKVVGIPGQKVTLSFRDGGRDVVGGSRAGTVVGELTVGGGAGARSVPLALRSEFPEPSVGAKLTRLG